MSSRRAVLITYPDHFALQEAMGLAEAAGYHVVKTYTQRFLNRAPYAVGVGKAGEIERGVQELAADVILFDQKLRSVQIYNLAKLVGVEVIDRERLILEIFSKRASTAEAKLQVRLAELTYEMPRAREKVRLAKTGEQPGFYGLGKYEVDVYYRDIKRRIGVLNRKLQSITQRRELHRLQRRRFNIPAVSFAGYTGAGKTTLFNLLTSENREVGQGAFTTLSPMMRAVDFSGAKFLLSDTVGFISRLPAYMIQAFRSTLEELTHAGLVLLVVDMSEPLKEMRIRYESCVGILTDLQVSPSRVFVVFNKADLATLEEAERKREVLGVVKESSAVVSGKTGLGIIGLKEKVCSLLFEYEVSRFSLRADELPGLAAELDRLKEHAEVKLTPQRDGSLEAFVRGPAWLVERFRTLQKGLR